MQATNRRKQIEAWFKRPKPKIWWILVAIVVNFYYWTSFFSGWSSIPMALALVVFPCFAYVTLKKRYEERPSDSEMTKWLEEDLETLKENSLDQVPLDLSEAIVESITLRGPVWQVRTGVNDKEIRRRQMDEGDVIEDPEDPRTFEFEHLYLYSLWDIMIVHIGADSLVVYTGQYDWPRNRVINDATEEYSYGSIVSVRTSNLSVEAPVFALKKPLGSTKTRSWDMTEFSENLEYAKREGKSIISEQYKTFTIELSNGDSIGLAIPIHSQDPGERPSKQFITYGSKEISELMDKTVNAIRPKLRVRNTADVPIDQKAPQSIESGATNEPAVKLQQLKKMLDDGLITEAEFNEKRKQILDSM